jgi:RimJ/RimL family protein N-acetyltransferase
MAAKIHLRLARPEDGSQLLVWRNDAITRCNSLSSDFVTAEQHTKWLTNSLKNPDRQLYIAETDDIAIGTVRVDSSANTHTISWTLAPEYRGKGLAKAMVAMLVKRLRGTIVAEILPGNTASIRVAEHAGLRYQYSRNNILYYGSQRPNTPED